MAIPKHSSLLQTRLNDMARDREGLATRNVLSAVIDHESQSGSREERLADLESVARSAWDALEQNTNRWADALFKIRDENLFELTHDSFEAYLRDQWSDRLSRSRAWQLIGAARVRAALEVAQINELPEPQLDIKTVYNVDRSALPYALPERESQARELTPLLREGPGAVREVWAQAVEEYGPQPMAQEIHEVREKYEVERAVPSISRRPVVIQVGRSERPDHRMNVLLSRVEQLEVAIKKHHMGWSKKTVRCDVCGEKV
jgi:hypothetical protein